MTMIEEKLSHLVTTILEKTKAGKISWRPSATRDNDFLAAFSRHGVIIRKESTFYNKTHFVIVFMNDQGKEIESKDEFNSDSPEYKDLEELFILARRSAHNAEQSLDNLLKELESR